MTKEQYRELRPIVENLMAFILYLRFGGTHIIGTMTLEVSPSQMLILAKVFTTQFEQEFRFQD